MYCSVKFLSPIVMGGLPLPGWSELAEPPEEVLLSLLEPHAVSASARATASRAARPRVQVRCVTVVPPEEWGSVGGPRHGLRGLGLNSGVVDTGTQPARRHQPLQAGEQDVDREGEHCDADRGAEHAGKPIA